MIEVQNIEKSFGSKKVLKKISLKVKKGTVYGLIGENGAGKTTLINIIAGLSDASSGQCYISGEVIGKEKNIKTKIGYLPDTPVFFDYLSTGEYLDFLLRDLNNIERQQKRKELLKLVKLEDNIRIKTMSRGMKQRLGIAATLVNDPDIILLDEPTSALDLFGRNELMGILKTLRQEQKTILLSTHILTDMEKICDEVGFLYEGLILKHISIKQMTKQGNSLRILFEDTVSLNPFDLEMLDIVEVNSTEFIFKMNENDLLKSQKYLFEYLSNLPALILEIKKETQSLDDIFQEVCKK